MKNSAEESQGLERLLGRLAGRKAAKPPGQLPRERFITGESHREHRGLVAARRVLTVLVSVGLVYAITDLLRPLGALAALSGVAVAAAALLLVLPLLEITLGAGTHWEVHYKAAVRGLRKHRFEPSLGRFTDVLPPLAISVLAQLAGFASLHSWASRAFAGGYSESLSAIPALYYSFVTFSGGAAGVAPEGDAARALTGLQAILGWLTGVVVVATVLAWIIRDQRPTKVPPSFE